MKSYVLRVVVEPDEDRWAAYCPELVKYGGSTWGFTKEEAQKNIREVLEMVLEYMVENNYSISEIPTEEQGVSSGQRITVTV